MSAPSLCYDINKFLKKCALYSIIALGTIKKSHAQIANAQAFEQYNAGSLQSTFGASRHLLSFSGSILSFWAQGALEKAPSFNAAWLGVEGQYHLGKISVFGSVNAIPYQKIGDYRFWGRHCDVGADLFRWVQVKIRQTSTQSVTSEKFSSISHLSAADLICTGWLKKSFGIYALAIFGKNEDIKAENPYQPKQFGLGIHCIRWLNASMTYSMTRDLSAIKDWKNYGLHFSLIPSLSRNSMGIPTAPTYTLRLNHSLPMQLSPLETIKINALETEHALAIVNKTNIVENDPIFDGSTICDLDASFDMSTVSCFSEHDDSLEFVVDDDIYSTIVDLDTKDETSFINEIAVKKEETNYLKDRESIADLPVPPTYKKTQTKSVTSKYLTSSNSHIAPRSDHSAPQNHPSIQIRPVVRSQPAAIPIAWPNRLMSNASKTSEDIIVEKVYKELTPEERLKIQNASICLQRPMPITHHSYVQSQPAPHNPVEKLTPLKSSPLAAFANNRSKIILEPSYRFIDHSSSRQSSLPYQITPVYGQSGYDPRIHHPQRKKEGCFNQCMSCEIEC